MSTAPDADMRKKLSPRYVIELSRKLRLTMTPAEKLLWERLRKRNMNGLRFRAQHPIGRYIVDFFCHEHNLVLELDGAIHKKQEPYDRVKDAYLKAFGYTVLRFTNDSIFHDMEHVLAQIQNGAHDTACNESAPAGF